ncbi:flagellar basal body-associated FliL family protein [Carnobacterium funditum]|uniref:flagellar basal body-associated FliL family protein n=1 Tax=Carnobacterium funditum TaxID=2752 RepID=UPI0005511B82|nr:flagellar basal body-associated FliL family protein [Carnobacterium funditum]
MQNKSSEKKNDGNENKKKKRWLVPMIIIVVTLIIGGIVSFGFTSGKAQAFVENLKEEKEVEITVPLEEFLINLTPETGKKEQFLKIELSVYSSEKDSQEVIDTKIPQIRNAVINVLRKQTADTVFGEDQELIALKQELISQINKALGKPVISDIFITNIIMQ